MATISVRSSDNELFEVDTKIIKCSGLITRLLEDCVMGDSYIPLKHVNSKTLRKILQWAEHHHNDPLDEEVDENEKKTDDLSPWDAEFMKVEQGLQLDLVLAANHLDIPKLLKTAAMAVGKPIKGKTAEEIRKYFNIDNPEPNTKLEKVPTGNEEKGRTSLPNNPEPNTKLEKVPTGKGKKGRTSLPDNPEPNTKLEKKPTGKGKKGRKSNPSKK